MALIKCTECGKEFSDRANACPNCGCPTDIILEDIAKEKSIQKKNIVASYDIGDHKFEIDSKMDYRIHLISDFCQKLDQIGSLTGKMYDELGNIDNVIERMPQTFSVILEGAINVAVDLLMKNKIMECDTNYFITNYGEELDATSLVEPIIVEYLKILKLDTEIKEYHDYIRNVHRNAWSGGGFGVKGAVKGYFKAQMMNAGSAFLTSFSDTKQFNNNMQEVQKAKAELFAREETKQCVVDSVLRIYTVCYSIALNKLKNAGIIDGTFFDTSKSNSIMNNVYNYLNNEEGEIDFEWLVNAGVQAFLENPTSEEAIYLLVRFLGENRMEPKTGIILYAKEYGFWNAYIDQRIDEIAEECMDDISDFIKLSELPNENAEAVSKIIDSFRNLKCKFMLPGIFTDWSQVLNRYHFDFYLKSAIEKNLNYDKSLEEKENILAVIKSALEDECNEHNPEETDIINFYNSAIEKIEKSTEINYDRKNLLDLVEDVCKSHSHDNACTQANGFYFWNLYNIKLHQDFKYFSKAVNFPNECKIYLLCGKLQYNSKTPKYVVAITEYGIYVYQKEIDGLEKIEIFCSWHNLETLNVKVCPEGGIYIGGKRFKYYTWELLHIMNDLKKQVKEFLEEPIYYDTNQNSKEDENVFHISKEECSDVIKDVCEVFSEDFSEEQINNAEYRIVYDINLFYNKIDIKKNKYFRYCEKRLSLGLMQCSKLYNFYLKFTDKSCEVVESVIAVTGDFLLIYNKDATKVVKWTDVIGNYLTLKEHLYGFVPTQKLIFAIFKALWNKEMEYRNKYILPENDVVQKKKRKNMIIAAINQFTLGERKRAEFILAGDIGEEEKKNSAYMLKMYINLGISPEEEVLGLIICGMSEETKFLREIAITDTRIHWYSNDGQLYYCEWNDFVQFDVTSKMDGSVLWNKCYIFKADILDMIIGKKIQKLLTMISEYLQREDTEKIIKNNNIDNESATTVTQEKVSSDNNLLTEKIIDCSKAGEFKALGCQKALLSMSRCLNTGETVTTILKTLNRLSMNHSECATKDVNMDLLDKIVIGRGVSRYFENGEKPLFYKDSAIMFYGKNGMLITNKAIYRIRKNGLRKLLFSKLESIHLVDIFEGKDECRWCFNNIREFDLDAMGINSEQSGIIMALVCLLFRENQPNKRIEFFNYMQ